MMDCILMDIITCKQAKDLGLKTYFTGEPCKNGHIAERDVSTSQCISCRKEADKRTYTKNKEAALARRNKFLVKNPEYHKEWWLRTRETRSAHIKKYREENKEKLLQGSKRWREANHDKMIKSRILRGFHERQATPLWTKNNEWEEFCHQEIYSLSVLRSCLTCVKHEVDHIIPLRSKSVCGLHWSGNLQILPKIANAKKGNKYQQDW